MTREIKKRMLHPKGGAFFFDDFGNRLFARNLNRSLLRNGAALCRQLNLIRNL